MVKTPGMTAFLIGVGAAQQPTTLQCGEAVKQEFNVVPLTNPPVGSRYLLANKLELNSVPYIRI